MALLLTLQLIFCKIAFLILKTCQLSGCSGVFVLVLIKRVNNTAKIKNTPASRMSLTRSHCPTSRKQKIAWKGFVRSSDPQ
jgi:hypothetical protein